MGDVYTQITRSDTCQGEGRPRQSLRERYSFSVLDSLPRADDPREPASGQAYVALSRATSLDGLQVLNFNPSKARLPIHLLHLHSTHRVAQVFVHEKVKEWSAKLETFSSPIVVKDSDEDSDGSDDDDDEDYDEDDVIEL